LNGTMDTPVQEEGHPYTPPSLSAPTSRSMHHADPCTNAKPYLRLATKRASTGMSSGLISFDASLIAGLYPGRAPDL
jgi:hypothetical protein